MNKILATVVTYNRKDLLVECLDNLKQSEYPCDVLVVDNASTDGTKEVIAPFIDNHQFKYINTGDNLGGAGGFNFALRQGTKLNYDYIWVMDDDTMVHRDTLSRLIEAAKSLDYNFGFLSSYVAFTDGKVCLMNIPTLESQDWYEGFDYSANLLKINRATFVSTLIPTKVILEKGLPLKEFFIWSDDTEYTRRISSTFPSYYVTDSIVTHKMAVNAGVNKNQFIIEDSERVNRFFYSFRNTFYLRKKAGLIPTLRYTGKLVYTFLSVLFRAKNYKFKKLGIILKGFWAGLFFNPDIEYVNK